MDTAESPLHDEGLLGRRESPEAEQMVKIFGDFQQTSGGKRSGAHIIGEDSNNYCLGEGVLIPLT